MRKGVVIGILLLMAIVTGALLTWGWRHFWREPEFGSIALVGAVIWAGIIDAILLLVLTVFLLLTRKRGAKGGSA